jgi:hypothetical protein
MYATASLMASIMAAEDKRVNDSLTAELASTTIEPGSPHQERTE